MYLQLLYPVQLLLEIKSLHLRKKLRNRQKLSLRNRPPQLLRKFRNSKEKQWKTDKNNISKGVTIESKGKTEATTEVADVKERESAKKENSTSPDIRLSRLMSPKKRSLTLILNQKSGDSETKRSNSSKAMVSL